MAPIVVESLFSYFHPFVGKLCWVLFCEGGFEGGLTSCLIFTIAEEIEDHVDNLYCCRLVDEAIIQDFQHFKDLFNIEELIVG